jgi:hypothetical protein
MKVDGSAFPLEINVGSQNRPKNEHLQCRVLKAISAAIDLFIS